MAHIFGNSDYSGHTKGRRTSQSSSMNRHPETLQSDNSWDRLLGHGTSHTAWSRPDNQGNDTSWLDHSVSTWMTTPTQWMNVLSVVTMLNTRSLAVSFRQSCDNNGHTDTLAKFEADMKTIKPQYETTDNDLETDHKAAMSLRKWHDEEGSLVTNSRVAMRIGTGHDMQLRSRVRILNSQIRMHGENDNDD
eukprot:6491042-Amphidinium_carterae.2